MAAGGTLTELRPFAGFVLAGGSSTRMGADKATIEVDGRTMLRVSVDALVDADSVGVIGGSGSDDVEIVPTPDSVPGLGPLGGIATALGLSDRPVTVIVSCDVPEIDPTAVRALVATIGDADLAVPVVAGRPQWTVGAWRTAVAPAIQQRIHAGELPIRRLSRRLRVAYLLGTEASYRDVDTPAELTRFG